MMKSQETKGKADDIDRLVGRRLKMRRMLLGVSQAELARIAGVSVQQIQKYEKSTNRISSGKLFTFAQFLKVPINYFYEKIDNPANNKTKPVFAVAEEQEAYQAEELDTISNKEIASDKEIMNLIKFFGELKDPQIRKKVVDLIKAMS